MQSQHWAGLLLFVSFVWGIEFSLVHLSLAHMGPNTFNALRFGIAVLTLAVFFVCRGQRFFARLHGRLLKHACVLGGLLYLGFITQTIGLLSTSASNAGFITGLNCVLVPVVSYFWLRRAQGPGVWCGVALATLGTALLTGGAQGFAVGEAWVLVCALCFAVHIVYTGEFVQESDPLLLTQLQLLVVTALSALTALLFEPESIAALPSLLLTEAGSPAVQLGPLQSNAWAVAWLALLMGGVLGTGLAYVAQTAGQQLLAPWRVALIFSTEPLFAALGGHTLLGESLTVMAYWGAACIVAGILLAELLTPSAPDKR